MPKIEDARTQRIESRIPLHGKPYPEDLDTRPYRIDYIVDLDEREWNDLVNRPLANRSWLAGISTAMIYGPSGQQMIINTEGYDYARYAARIR